MDPRNTDALRQRMNRRFEVFGTLLTDASHYVALLAIGAAIFGSEIFIYLELEAMVAICFRTTTCRCGS
jgi:hypothetical protein